MDPRQLSSIASALASETRAALVAALMGGTAHTGRELADHLGVAPSTVSEHLGVLFDAGLVTVEAQGRHRYVRLANADVAALVEAMGVLEARVAPVPRPQPKPGLRFARSCYDHLAGELGVSIYERLTDTGAVVGVDGGISLTATGRATLDQLGVDVEETDDGAHANRSRPVARACLDWSQRRHHLAGVAGSRLLAALLDHGWLRRHAERRRELRLTAEGRVALARHLGIEVP